jgi:Holliday junction DNA helicase RuvA
MFAYIKGELVFSSPTSVIVEANGIGYRILIPTSNFSQLPQLGEIVFLHVSFVVRELSHTLYGFLSTLDRDLFEMLQNVSGIGPKLALSVIAHISLQELRKAIGNHDLVIICKIPGIGKKTAERLIIELRDKLPAAFPHDPSEHFISLSDPKSQKIADAMNALINLGYNQITAQKAIKKTLQDHPDNIDLALLITHSLKNV